MSGFDVEAALNGLKDLVSTIPSIESCQIGAPESLSNRISAWVVVGDPGEIGSRVQGVYELDLSLIVFFAYVVEGQESASEAQLGDYITELVRRLIKNRAGAVDGVSRNLNGSVDILGLPQAAAGPADYAVYAGAEGRTYPVGVRVVQRENLGV
jgi:hypothetical protein